MANREITRNVFRQIISNELDPNGVFTDYDLHLLQWGLTTFNRESYRRILDMTSDTFIFDAGQVPDSTPRVISEQGFVDKTLFVDASFERLVNVTMYAGGDGITFHNGTDGHSVRDKFKKDVLDESHPLTPENFNTEIQVIYEPPLRKGSQLKERPAGIQTSFADAVDFTPSSGIKSHFVVKDFDRDKDPALRDSLDPSIVGSGDVQTDLLSKILNDKRSGGWSNNDFNNVRERLEIYDNKPFSALILEVLSDGTVNEVHRIGGDYQDTGDSSWSPGISDTMVGLAFPAVDAYKIITYITTLPSYSPS